MRRDLYIQNDSGGFSVIAADAVDAIIEDQRSDDLRFVDGHQAILLELYGDDSMPVRLVVDEALTADEEGQWLARASGRIDTEEGRLLVMGGFDPDILAGWRDEHGPDANGVGVGVIEAAPGKWRVDIYAHVGSMNGRAILDEMDEPVGAFFRRCHPGKPFPLWLARDLEFSGDDDPGHEDIWKQRIKGAVDAGRLTVDTENPSVVGFLVHVTRFDAARPLSETEGGWIARDAGMRAPTVFPLGLPSRAVDPGLQEIADEILGRTKPAPPEAIADRHHEIIEVWSGDPVRAIKGGSVNLPAKDAFHLFWIQALGCDSPPIFEAAIEAKGWTPPAATPKFSLTPKGPGVWTAGPPPNTGGWIAWTAAEELAVHFSNLPDGAMLDFATAPQPAGDDPDGPIGRACFSGTIRNGKWEISSASPDVSRGVLDDALGFIRELIERKRIHVRTDDEREAFEEAVESYSPEEESIDWEGDFASLAEDDSRMLRMLAAPVCRVRFGDVWRMDPVEED